jgi:hypothetical protein
VAGTNILTPSLSLADVCTRPGPESELGTDIPQAGKRVVDVLARFRFRDAPDEAPSWEGMARGREAEALRIVVAQLRRRVGPLPTSVEGRVASLNLLQLEALSESLLDLSSVAQLEAWLAAQA